MSNKLLVLIFSFFYLINIYAHEIRLYKDTDQATLRAVLMKNEDLLLPGPDFNTRVAETEKYFKSNNYITKVCIKDGKPVGFITYVKDGYLAPGFNILYGCIQLLAVVEKYYRQGIGKALVEVALEDMKHKKIQEVIVMTKVKNIASRALYEKLGFQILFPIAPFAEDCFYRFLVK